MSDLLKGIFENVFEDTTDNMSDNEEIENLYIERTIERLGLPMQVYGAFQNFSDKLTRTF